MKTEQSRWNANSGWTNSTNESLATSASVVLVFGDRSAIAEPTAISELNKRYPNATLFGCSTAGEIIGTEVSDQSIIATAVSFEKTEHKVASVEISGVTSFDAGRKLAEQVFRDDLRHVFVLSEGLNINGSELVNGLRESLPSSVTFSGGLAGDGATFQKTFVLNDGHALSDTASVLALYGDHIRVASASLGGWDSFGVERRITRAEGNVLYELDGKSALELYKSYLGEHADGLPASGLLFPLSISSGDGSQGLVRTILAVNEADQSITFAGNIPEGWNARLMKANFDRLIDGAVGAADIIRNTILQNAELAILISCVGRKMVLGQRVEEEVEGVRDVLGKQATITGFYSYGEISPFTPDAKCELHNQTMTITTLSEV